MATTTITVDGIKTELTIGAAYRLRYGADQLLHATLIRRERNGDLLLTARGSDTTRVRTRTIKSISPLTLEMDEEERDARQAARSDFDSLPDAYPERQDGEPAAAFLARAEAELGAGYTAWVGSDAGQAALEEAAREAKPTRQVQTRAEKRAAALEEAAAVRAAADAARKPGAVEIVAPPTNGKPSRAARKALGIAEEPKPAPAKRSPRSSEAKPKPITNPPLNLRDEPIELEGGLYRALLRRDGSLSEHQDHNVIWRCASCGKRLRAAECKNGHKAVKAPAGYRFEDRKWTA